MGNTFKLSSYPCKLDINSKLELYDFIIHPNKVYYIPTGGVAPRLNRLSHKEFYKIIIASHRRLTPKQLDTIERYYIKNFAKCYRAGYRHLEEEISRM